MSNGKSKNKIQLTKNKINLNNRKMKYYTAIAHALSFPEIATPRSSGELSKSPTPINYPLPPG